MSLLRQIERARFAAQLVALDRQIAADVAALEREERESWRAARQRVVEEQQRDKSRLLAALEGKRPSAVLGRAEPAVEQQAEAATEFACDEAIHLAENALHFFGPLLAPDAEPPTDAATLRGTRWLLRLRRELLDTPRPRGAVAYHDAAIELLASLASDRPALVERVAEALRQDIAQLKR